MLTSFSYTRLSNVSEHEIDDWYLWSVFGDIDRSRYNCSFDTIRDRVYFIPGYNVIRSSILLFTHDLTRLNYSRRERTIDIPTLVKIFYNRNRGKESLDKDPSFAVPINGKTRSSTILLYLSSATIQSSIPIITRYWYREIRETKRLNDDDDSIVQTWLVCERQKCHTELSLFAMTIGVLILPSFCDWMQHWAGILASTSLASKAVLGHVLATTPRPVYSIGGLIVIDIDWTLWLGQCCLGSVQTPLW